MRYTTDSDLVKDSVRDLFVDLHQYRSSLAGEVNVKFSLLKSLRRKLHHAHRKTSLPSLERWTSEEPLAMSTFSFSIEHEIIMDENQRALLQMRSVEIN